MNENLWRLRALFPNFRWEGLSWAHAGGPLATRRNGTLLGLGVLTPNMKLDTTLARRLRGEAGIQHREMELDPDLEVLQQSLLLGAGWQGSSRILKRMMDRLVADYGVFSGSEASARLAAETTYQLVLGNISKDGLMHFLQGKTQGGSLEQIFEAFKERMDSAKALPDSILAFTEEPSVENLLFSSLGLVLSSSGEPLRFVQDLQRMEEAAGPGFHPTVALGLFGALHGQGKLPAPLIPKDFQPEHYLNRAQQEFLRGTFDRR
jgi:hypothetical protein